MPEGELPGQHGMLTAVVLVYCGAFEPFGLQDAEVIRRAEATLSRHPRGEVVGALVVPYSDRHLQDWNPTREDKMPFDVRKKVALGVLKEQGMDGRVLVDSCTESCLKHCPGSVVPHMSIYAKSRLHNQHCRVKVIEVHGDDCLSSSRTEDPLQSQPFDTVFVGRGNSKPDVASPYRQLSEINHIVIDCPKYRQDIGAMKSLLHGRPWTAEGETGGVPLNARCGALGAQILSSWAKAERDLRRRGGQVIREQMDEL